MSREEDARGAQRHRALMTAFQTGRPVRPVHGEAKRYADGAREALADAVEVTAEPPPAERLTPQTVMAGQAGGALERAEVSAPPRNVKFGRWPGGSIERGLAQPLLLPQLRRPVRRGRRERGDTRPARHLAPVAVSRPGDCQLGALNRPMIVRGRARKGARA